MADRQSGDHMPIDWEAIERSPEFRELVARKKKFVAPRVAFFLLWYTGFVLLAGYAPDFMGERIYEGFTVGYALALTQFVMVWYLAWSYVRKADKEFEPLERQAVAHIEEGSITAYEAEKPRAGRFDRPSGAGAPSTGKPGGVTS